MHFFFACELAAILHNILEVKPIIPSVMSFNYPSLTKGEGTEVN